MSNPKRTQDDIESIKIHTFYPGFAGWIVDIRYKDNKCATLRIDRGQDPDFDMVEEASECVRLQMAGYADD
jgi:hypothetical protein